MDIPLTEESRREERALTLFYWGCQVLGWAAYSAIGIVINLRTTGGFNRGMLIGYGLFFVYSIALTHQLRRLIERRGWLALPPAKALLRVGLAAFATASLQTFLVLLVEAVTTGISGFLNYPAMGLMLWLNISFGTFIWTGVYVGVASMFWTRWAAKRAKAMESSLQEARLKTLEAQMSPHFLFNSLNSIRGLVTENPASARDMITRLANLLRHGLQSANQSTAPLADELAVVDDYLALEGIRLEERLQLQRRVDPSTLTTPLPTMLLQTLVENAIKHGIASSPEGGLLDLAVSRREQGIEIRITNPGTLRAPAPGSTQVGLANARERLRILHGDKASLELRQETPDRVLTLVSIPFTAAPLHP